MTGADASKTKTCRIDQKLLYILCKNAERIHTLFTFLSLSFIGLVWLYLTWIFIFSQYLLGKCFFTSFVNRSIQMPNNFLSLGFREAYDSPFCIFFNSPLRVPNIKVQLRNKIRNSWCSKSFRCHQNNGEYQEKHF